MYVSTTQNSGFIERATSSATASGTQVTLEATGLSQYTTYYYYVTVTDGKETATSTTSSQRTYCPGTGLTCNGPFTSVVDCKKCGGTGKMTVDYHIVIVGGRIVGPQINGYCAVCQKLRRRLWA